jgi:hypothetical protein
VLTTSCVIRCEPIRSLVLYPLSYGRIQQDVEEPLFFTRPTLARRDMPFTKLRARVIQRLHLPKRVRLASSLAAALPTALLSILIMVPTGGATIPSNRFTL